MNRSFVTHATAPADKPVLIHMSMLQGTIQASIAQLEQAFGEPLRFLEGGGAQTSREWHIRFDDDTVATIYDWQKTALGAAPEDVLVWRIGGMKREAAELVHQAFRVAMGLKAAV